ncbi:MAG TPA: hypothetical protein VF520_10945 [Thermoleophilaceae bacterium]|jgi:sulfur carrier protein ThiS
MVEPITVAAGLVGAYLQHLSQRAADQAVEELDERAERGLLGLYRLVKNKLTGHDHGKAVLARVEEEPANERRQAALADVLDEVGRDDQQFAAELERQVDEATASLAGRIEISDSGAVAIGGSVTQRGTYVAGRDLTVEPDRRTR